MTTIHFVTSGKGNSGKSVFASALIDLLKMNTRSVKVFDADPQHQTSTGFHPDAEQLVLGYDPELEEMPMLIYHASCKVDEKEQPVYSDIVCDLAADTDLHINTWMEVIGIADIIQHQNINVYKWWVADGSKESLVDFKKSSEDFPSVKHVLVKNYAKRRDKSWTAALAVVEGFDMPENVSVIHIPKVYGSLADELRASNTRWKTVIDAYRKKDWTVHKVATCSVVNRWFETVKEQIEIAYKVTGDAAKDTTKKPVSKDSKN